MMVMVHDYGGGRGARRRRDNFFHVLVPAPLADGIEPHAEGPGEQQQVRDPVPARRGVFRLRPRVHLDLCGKQVSQVIQ